jgi:hypothetical protein
VSELILGVRDRVDRTLSAVRRTTTGPLLVRAGIFFAALGALLLSWPLDILGAWTPIACIVLATLPALHSRGMLVSLVLWAAVLGWLATTTVYGAGVPFWRLVLLAGLLYLVHTLSALAAVLPYDAVVDPRVIRDWLRRAGLVIVLTIGVALFAVAVPQLVGRGHYLLASVAGIGLMVAAAGYLAGMLRRR